MDIKLFLDDYNISYREGGKNWSEGWAMINCPFCGDSGYHGGLNIKGAYYNCWKCGNKPISILIMKLLNIKSFTKAKAIIRDYAKNFVREKVKKKKGEASICKLPFGCHPLQETHWNYLKKRGYRPLKTAETWILMGTGPIGDYRFRIIAPIFVDGVMVSYQGRDITDKQTLRYKACASKDEIIHHKHIVYGIDLIKDGKCIIVEGITDAWRLGPGAIALFGNSWTEEQLLFIKNRVKGGYICFDPDSVGKGTKLALELNALGCCFSVIELKEKDPGEFNQTEVNFIMDLIK